MVLTRRHYCKFLPRRDCQRRVCFCQKLICHTITQWMKSEPQSTIGPMLSSPHYTETPSKSFWFNTLVRTTQPQRGRANSRLRFCEWHQSTATIASSVLAWICWQRQSSKLSTTTSDYIFSNKYGLQIQRDFCLWLLNSIYIGSWLSST